ncbi:MAG: WGxxGxxG-CTERM domain-containing protein [Acidobacteriota bacterium]|nr:WGxxGxxG-CTERM domain-containing protein [Acidobacteriota bacterium]
MKNIKRLAMYALATGFLVATATAQTTATDTTNTAGSNMNNTRTDDGRGFDYGWLGLLGLAGLLGLRRPAVRDDLRTGTTRT